METINNIEGEKNIANAFTIYFEAVPGKTKTKILKYKRPYMQYVNKSKVVNYYLVLSETNIEEVYYFVTKLKDEPRTLHRSKKT
jgi:hypothetical protein